MLLYKPIKSGTKRIAQHSIIRHEDNERLAQSWHEQITLQNEYKGYCQSFLDLLSKFGTLSDKPFGTVTTRKRRIEVVESSTPPVRFSFYRAGLKAREIEKTQTTEMLENNIIKSAQTIGATSTVFEP